MIIGTALSAINGAGGIFSLMGGKGSNTSCGAQAGITNEELYLERSQCQNYLDTTKRYYEGKIEETDKMNTAFFRLYKNDVDMHFLFIRVREIVMIFLQAKSMRLIRKLI